VAENYKIRSVIICDDIRREDNGKEICIGVYAGIIITSRFPAVLAKLSVRMEFEDLPAGVHSVDIEVVDPRGNKVFSVSGEIEAPSIAEPGALSLGQGPVILPVEGKYTIRFGFDNHIRPVSRFLVRLPQPTGPGQ
jgi:hypothetical protein